MPKSFSEPEREYIKQRLLEEAGECLAVFGIRKTTVDEVVRRVGIPKGTFYLFYDSKDALILDTILKINGEVQSQLLERVAGMQKKPDAEALTDIIFSMYLAVKDSFLLKLMASGELDFYMRKAPPEFSARHAEEDAFMVKQLMALFPKMDQEKSELYSSALRGVFLTTLYEKEIAYADFDAMLRMMIRGIVIQMFGG